jgi:lincosamide nucleotidyltransferase A/C/D/E
VELLDILAAAAIDAWVDGGWGVDALLGRQTRPHDDLDLVVRLGCAARIRDALAARGFCLSEDQLPVRFVVAHPTLGRIDFHTVTFDDAGGGVQPQPSGGTFRYPATGFVSGSIDGRRVACVSAEVQMLCHLGYEPRPHDVQDVMALHTAFGIALPGRYRTAAGAAPPRYTIALARPADIPALAAIELAAGALLEGHAPASVLNEPTSEAEVRHAQEMGLLWVARDGDVPVGFAHVEMLAPDLPHLEELDVHPEHGRCGLGTTLVRAVCEWARRAGYATLTLTTFRDVPWNMPFYARLGFVELAAATLRPELAAVVRNEAARGLAAERRVVMVYRTGVGDPPRA